MTPQVTRRSVLRGTAALAAGAVVVGAGAACDRGPSPAEVTANALLPVADAALADEAAARALIPRSTEYGAALKVIADQRADHARALRDEITRLHPDLATRIAGPSVAGAPPSGPTSAAPGSTAPTSPGPVAITTVTELRSRLRASAKGAADAAARLEGYSAGLAASIGAAVTTHVEVQLA